MRHLATPLLLTIVLAACGDGAPAASTPPPATTPTSGTVATSTTTSHVRGLPDGEALPPHDRDELAALFDPVAESLGYRVTRAALIDRGTYQVDPEGGHLAIYLVPLEDLGVEALAADVIPIARAFVPAVFGTWPDLDSFDVCQEPFGYEGETPPSLTILDLTRDAAGQVDWPEVDLAGLIDHSGQIDGLTLWAGTTIRRSETWQDAAAG